MYDDHHDVNICIDVVRLQDMESEPPAAARGPVSIESARLPHGQPRRLSLKSRPIRKRVSGSAGSLSPQVMNWRLSYRLARLAGHAAVGELQRVGKVAERAGEIEHVADPDGGAEGQPQLLCLRRPEILHCVHCPNGRASPVRMHSGLGPV